MKNTLRNKRLHIEAMIQLVILLVSEVKGVIWACFGFLFRWEIGEDGEQHKKVLNRIVW